MKKENFKLNIRDVNSKGQGVALRADGKIVFVEGALTGETVIASIKLEKKNYATAQIEEIEKASNSRVKPLCPWFEKCGGCQLQHASYDLQLKLKISHVESCFSKISGIDVKHVECEPSPEIWGYRNKASFPIRSVRGGEIGFFKTGSHDLIPVDRCPVLIESAEIAYKKIREQFIPAMKNLKGSFYDERRNNGLLRHLTLRGNVDGDIMLMPVLTSLKKNSSLKFLSDQIELLRNELPDISTVVLNCNNQRGNRITGDTNEILFGTGTLQEKLGPYSLTYDGSSFFQVNTKQAEKLFRYAADLMSSAKKVVELYCGVGALTAYLAENSDHILAIEEWAPAIKKLKDNMECNSITTVDGIVGRAEKKLSEFVSEKPDVIVLDPPRSGCQPEVLDAIAESSAKQVVYVSCNPSTLARDVRILLDHGFDFISVKSFDLFPHTCHVESVVLMSRANSKSTLSI